MSRPTTRQYPYPVQSTLPNGPPGYYYDDMEGYVGDYSESDEGGAHIAVAPNPPELTEIYRRKPPVHNTKEQQYQQNVYTPQE